MATKKAAQKDSSTYKSHADRVREKAKELSGDARWWKPKPGKNFVRILPPKDSDGVFFLKGGLHYGFNIGGRDRAIPCPQVSRRGDCAVCEVVNKAKGNEDMEKLVAKLRVKVKFWFNMIDRKNSEKVQLYSLSKKNIDPVLDAFEDEDLGDVTDPDNGHDVVITKTGEGQFGTRYAVRVRPKSSPLGIDDWEEKLQDFDQILEWMSYPEVVKALKAQYSDELDELGMKFSKVKEEKTEAKPKKKTIKKEEEIDDDDEEEDDEEPTEEEEDDEDE